MFEIKKKNEKLKIVLKESCDISEVEEFLKEIKKKIEGKNIKEIEISLSENTTIDTSFFQVLLSLKKSEYKIIFPRGKSSLEELESLYGIKI